MWLSRKRVTRLISEICIHIGGEMTLLFQAYDIRLVNFILLVNSIYYKMGNMPERYILMTINLLNISSVALNSKL